MSLALTPATTLKDAYRICDVVPLEGTDFERYYVALTGVRNRRAIAGVLKRLEYLEPGETSAILFTGHRGCGKSTELKRIQNQLEASYQVIYLDVEQEVDVNDLVYSDLYLVVIKHIEIALRQLKLSLNEKLKNSFERWFAEVTEETEETVEKSVGIDSEASLGLNPGFLAKLLAKVTAKIKGAFKEKTTIRKVLEQDISRLLSDINLLLDDASDKLRKKHPEKKGFLIIFDNLDRLAPEIADRLFFNYANQLRSVRCNIIYTVPISVLCSERNITNVFDDPHLISMPNVYHLDRSQWQLAYNPQALDEVAQILEQRMDVAQLFESRDVLLMLVQASGGHVRQLMTMARNAIMSADINEHDRVLAEDVTYAINQQQFSFERLVPQKHYTKLAAVMGDKSVPVDQDGKLMLFNLSVLEYNGTNRWNYPNPVVQRSEAFQDALRRQMA